MGRQRTYDHEAILIMRGRGLVPKDIAARLEIPVKSVEAVIRIARDRGDLRAARNFQPAIVMEEQGTAHALDRPGIMVVYVVTMDRNNGLARKVPVSLPRVSILGGWHGRAATEIGGAVG